MKSIIKRVLRSSGYEIRRTVARKSEPDAFFDMEQLCTGHDDLVVFDVGAHHGQTASDFRKAFPSARIFCFEPFAESFEILRSTVAGDRRIQIFNYGLSNCDGALDFNINPSSATNSLLQTDTAASLAWDQNLLETKEVVRADFRTLDSVVRKLDLPKINILKLDVQGAEHMVVDGAAMSCQAGVIDMIYSEIITQPTYAGQKRVDAALAVFLDRGFDVHNIYNLSLTRNGKLRQVDVFFTRRGWPDR